MVIFQPATSAAPANQMQPLQRPTSMHSDVSSSGRPAKSAVQPITLPSPRSPPITNRAPAVDLLADFGSQSVTASQPQAETTTGTADSIN